MVICKVTALSMLLLLLSSPQSWTEESLGLQFILNSNPLVQPKKKIKIKKEESELKLFFTGGIRFYQLFISPQDMPSCVFTPSCSHFGLEVVKRCGPLKGILLTSDRLQRCHSLGLGNYHLDEKTKKAKDPVKDYIFD